MNKCMTIYKIRDGGFIVTSIVETTGFGQGPLFATTEFDDAVRYIKAWFDEPTVDKKITRIGKE